MHLRAANVPFQIVPGITAAFAAAAQIGCSLTDRRSASSVEFHTGHKAADDDGGVAESSATRVIYMPGRSFRLARDRVAAGRGPAGDALLRDQPCRAAGPEHRVEHVGGAGRGHSRYRLPCCC